MSNIQWTYTGPQKNDVPEGLRCQWSNKTMGQCREEGEFAITWGFPPCGCQDEEGNSRRFCSRHLLRAMHSLMGKYTCPTCGREYRGIQRLQGITRL